MVRIQSYSKLIKATVIIGDTLLCGVIFELFCFFWAGTHWEKILSAPKAQIILTLLLCYVLCSMKRSVILYKRKVYAYQIVTLVFLNVFYFAVLSDSCHRAVHGCVVLFLFGLYHRTVCLYRVFQIAFAFFHQEFPSER